MSQSVKLADFLDFWLETAVKRTVRYNTYAAYKGYADNHVKRLLGAKELFELKTEELQRFVYELAGEGSGRALSAKTVRLIVSMLSGCLQSAVSYGRISVNPCLRLRLPKVTDGGVKAFTRALANTPCIPALCKRQASPR
ncbi:MAG: hypothetical protein LBP26_03095 [Clostridiales bacterium]|jgi:site-specific recombinase XerC|nr:hypothetical protein [Clostridiales bacterium]